MMDYEKLARDTWGKTSADTSYEKRDVAVIAQALERAALERGIDQMMWVWENCEFATLKAAAIFDAEVDRLRARLAELKEADHDRS